MNKHIVVILVSEEKQNIDSLSNSQEHVPMNQAIKKKLEGKKLEARFISYLMGK